MKSFYSNLFSDVPEPDREALQQLARILTADITSAADTIEIINDIESCYDAFGLSETLQLAKSSNEEIKTMSY